MKYLISFPSSAMQVSEQDLPAVSDAARAVVEQAKRAGVWVFGGGIDECAAGHGRWGWHCDARHVPADTADRRRLHGPGGAFREVALEWARKFAVACRCAQEVREFQYDPAS